MKKLSFLPRTGWIILSMFFMPVGLAAPANDNLPAALNIETLPYTHQQNTSDASNEPAEALPQCLNNVGASLWYQYTPTTNQTLVFDTFGSNYDTALSLWSGTAHPLTPLACNDDSSNTLQSQLLVQLEANTTYYLNISGYNGKSGTLRLNARQLNPLVNDALAYAIEITLDNNASYTYTQNTQGATKEANEVETRCVLKGTVASVWYQYTSTTDRRVVFNTIGSDYNTILSVWTGDSTHPLTELACNDDNGTPQSQVAVELTAQTPYYINIAASNSLGAPLLEGTRLLVFNVTSPPANDNLANAIPITDSLPYIHSQNTGGATLETNELSPSCVSNASASVWYSFTPTTDYDNVTFSTLESGFLDTVLSVWQGSTHPLEEKACNNNAVAVDQSLTSQLTMPLTANTPYFINVSGVSGKTGHLVLRVDDKKTDFQIGSQPQAQTIDACTTATFTVDLSTPSGERINVTDNTDNNSVEFPFIYRWYEGESGDDSRLVIQMNNNNRFTTPALGETSNYWVRITNPTGTIDSETVTVTVAENTSNNGTGVDAEGNPLSTKAHFVGLVTNLPGGDKNVPLVSRDETIFVTFTIKVDTNHIRQPADIFTVGKYTTADDIIHYFMRDGDNWISWDGKNIAGLAVADQQETLPGCINISVFDGQLKNMPGDFTAFVGYRLSNGELYFNGEPVINFTVE
jgi:hypothetical protein